MVDIILQHLGITQRALAVFLDTDPTQLNRFAAGTRSLPPFVVPRAAQLYVAITKLLVEEAPMPTAAEAADMQQEAKWCRTLCRPLQIKLALAKKRYQQAGLVLRWLNEVGDAEAAVSEKKKRWVDTQRYEAQMKQEANGWAVQKKLEIAIDQLQHKAESYEAIVFVDNDKQ